MMQQAVEAAVKKITQRSDIQSHKFAIMMGSGLSLQPVIKNVVTISYSELPGFLDASLPGHPYQMVFGELSGVPIVCFEGRAHYYQDPSPSEIIVPIRVVKGLGCDRIIFTNSAASLRQEIGPGELVAITDHINFQGRNPLVGENDEAIGPQFFAMDQAYDKQLRQKFKDAAKAVDLVLHDGVYLAVLGPNYETPAEIKAFRLLGADVLAMSLVPEVLVAKHCGLTVAAISAIANLASDLHNKPLTHQEVLEMGAVCSLKLQALLSQFANSLEG